jgi:hypothetical protein
MPVQESNTPIFVLDAISKSAVVQEDITFANILPSGQTLASVAFVHTPPSGGTAGTPTAGSITANVVPVVFGPLNTTGLHYIDMLGTTSGSQKYPVRLVVPVEW